MLSSENMGFLDIPPEKFMYLTPGKTEPFKNIAVMDATCGKLTFDLSFEAA